jgi:hypothetical protein
LAVCAAEVRTTSGWVVGVPVSSRGLQAESNSRTRKVDDKRSAIDLGKFGIGFT